MAQLFTTDIAFPSYEDAQSFLNGLGYRRIPVRGRVVLVSEGFDDFGAPIMTFARQHLGNPLAYTLSDVARKAA
jgi:hypothetical protein